MFGLLRGAIGAAGRGAGGVAGAVAGRLRGGRSSGSAAAPPLQQGMSADISSTGLGAASDMKPPTVGADAPSEPRTFMRSPMQTLGGQSEFRGQGSSLRSATRRNNRRAGRALSR